MKRKLLFSLALLALAPILPLQADFYWLAVGIHYNAGYNQNGGLGNYLILTNDNLEVTNYKPVKLYDVRRTVDGGTKLRKINNQNGTAPYDGCPYGGAHYDLTLPIRDKDGNEFTFVGLDSGAFNGNNFIGSIKLPNTLEFIKTKAFIFARYLKTCTFPEDTSNMTELSDHVFDSCDLFEGPIVWPPQFTTVGDFSFAHCKKFLGFYGPSVTSVGNSAFNECPSMKAVEFGASVTFGPSVFQNTRGARYQILFHDAPPAFDDNNNLIGNSNGVLDWWGNGNAEATLYVPLNANKDGPTANWAAFKQAFESKVEGNAITWPTASGDGTWADGSIYSKLPNKRSTLRFWNPDTQTTAALLVH